MVKFLNNYPIISGSLMFLIGVCWLFFRLKKKESFKMKDHGLASWGEMVSTWGLIIFTILWGTILILRNI